MQHHTGADIWTSPACGCKPSKPSRVCEIGARPSATDKPQQGCSKDKPREPSGRREKRAKARQKAGTSNAGKALFNGIIYRANVCIMPVELNLIFSKLEIIIKVSINGYIPMNYIAAVQLIPGLVDLQLYCFNTLIFNILNIVETAGFAAVCRDLPPGTDETGKRIVKPYKSMNYGKMDTLFGTERQRQ